MGRGPKGGRREIAGPPFAFMLVVVLLRCLIVLVVLVAACGGGKQAAPPAENRPQATPRLADAGVEVARSWPDAGEPADPVVRADAGLMELGAAQCEMLIARFIACPQIGAEIKDELRKKQEEIRRMAVDPKNREAVAGACRQLVEAMEETLRRLSC